LSFVIGTEYKGNDLKMEIEIIRQVTDEIVDAFAYLIPQLHPHIPAPTRDDLERISASDSVIVFLARESGPERKIIGTAGLVTYQTTTGLHGWIEDVVVNSAVRRQGVGRALTEACLVKARDLGLDVVNLTSRPSREAANQLYQRMGFEKRETNVYQFWL